MTIDVDADAQLVALALVRGVLVGATAAELLAAVADHVGEHPERSERTSLNALIGPHRRVRLAVMLGTREG